MNSAISCSVYYILSSAVLLFYFTLFCSIPFCSIPKGILKGTGIKLLGEFRGPKVTDSSDSTVAYVSSEVPACDRLTYKGRKLGHCVHGMYCFPSVEYQPCFSLQTSCSRPWRSLMRIGLFIHLLIGIWRESYRTGREARVGCGEDTQPWIFWILTVDAVAAL